MIPCAVCGLPIRPATGESFRDHPIHSDEELAPHKLAVEMAAKVLAVEVLARMAERVLAS